MNCKNNTPAALVTQTSSVSHFNRLKTVCPMLVEEGATEAHACCNEAQLNTLERQLAASRLLFSRCPSCDMNFVAFYCQVSFIFIPYIL